MIRVSTIAAGDGLLIANRGEIALRIARTVRAMGMRAVMVASDADRDAPHAFAGDACVAIGGERPVDSYLRIDRIVAAAKASGATAVHPGYGFLAERADFAQAVIDAGLVWVGPPPATMTALGRKGDARRLAASLGVPVVPGYDGVDQADDTFLAHAQRIGLPLLVKASAGGGGRGMRWVDHMNDMPAALAAARREAMAAFADATLILERAVQQARHVEIQVFADTHGNVIHLGERECSVQRRHQKLVEEAPCPVLSPELRRRMGECACTLARAVGYVGAGTVEMLFDAARAQFYFMEMNTRLQVEHPVTEALLGVDLVEWQLRVAAGEPLPMSQQAALDAYENGGHAIEVRLCAEDPRDSDLPQAGCMQAWRAPQGVRCDHALADGVTVAPFYDSMLAKLVAHAPSRASTNAPADEPKRASSRLDHADAASAARDEARLKLAQALDHTLALGVPTNRALLSALLRHGDFARAQVTTTWLESTFVDRTAALPAVPDETIALAALWLATQGSAGLSVAWANSTLAAPLGQRVELRVNGGALLKAEIACINGSAPSSDERHARSLRVDGCEPVVFTRSSWHRDGTLLSLIAQRDNGMVLRLDAAPSTDARGVTNLHARQGAVDFAVLEERYAPPPSTTAQAGGDVRAPMHGRLVRLHVKLGDTVQRGQALAVLEAMKMEHTLFAPIDGCVQSLGAAQGQQVSPAVVLVVIREKQAAPEGAAPDAAHEAHVFGGVT